jgi:putative transcriptional regulator
MAATASDLVTPVLLVAMPQVLDPFFHKSVVLLIHHREDAVAYFGGPVQPQLGTVLFERASGPGAHPDSGTAPRPDPGPREARPEGEAEPFASESATEVMDGIALSQHVGDLSRLAEKPPERFRLFLGYAGWGAGQLIAEILRNDWLTAPVRSDLIFAADPLEAWAAALESVGVDPSALPSWTSGPGDGEEKTN